MPFTVGNLGLRLNFPLAGAEPNEAATFAAAAWSAAIISAAEAARRDCFFILKRVSHSLRTTSIHSDVFA